MKTEESIILPYDRFLELKEKAQEIESLNKGIKEGSKILCQFKLKEVGTVITYIYDNENELIEKIKSLVLDEKARVREMETKIEIDKYSIESLKRKIECKEEEFKKKERHLNTLLSDLQSLPLFLRIFKYHKFIQGCIKKIT